MAETPTRCSYATDQTPPPVDQRRKTRRRRKHHHHQKQRLRWEPCEFGCTYPPGRRLQLAERYVAAQRDGLTGDALAAYCPCPCVEHSFETTTTIGYCPAWQVQDGRRVYYESSSSAALATPDFVYLGVDEETEQRLRRAEEQQHRTTTKRLQTYCNPDYFARHQLVPYEIHTTVRVYRSAAVIAQIKDVLKEHAKEKARVKAKTADEIDIIHVVSIQDFARDTMRYVYAAADEAIPGITYDTERLPTTTKVVVYEVERDLRYQPAEYKKIQVINAGARAKAVQLGYLDA